MTGIALLGAGRMGQVHAAAIVEAGARISVVFDPVDAVARDLAGKTGAKLARSIEEAINDAATDAIIIATSSDTHADLLIQAVATGKPILCEKPLASSYSAARNCIATIGEKAARQIFLGFNRRFDRGHAGLREAVHAGHIGRLEQLVITSRDPHPPPLDYVPRSGGLFRDMMIHDFDMAHAITRQNFVSISAHGSAIIDERVGDLGDIDTAAVTLVTEDGTIVSILNSRRCAFGFDQRIEAFGADGMLISDNPRQSGLTRFSAEHPGSSAPILGFFMERYGASYAAEIRQFLECAHEGRDMPVNAIDGLMAAYLAEAATASRLSGQTIALTGPDQEFDNV